MSNLRLLVATVASKEVLFSSLLGEVSFDDINK